MIGPVINSCATLLGGALGATLSNGLKEKYRTRLPLTFGGASMAMGIALIVKMNTLPAVVFSLLLGSVIGEMLDIELNIGRLAGKLRGPLDRLMPQKGGGDGPAGLSNEEFIDKFVGILVLFVASGTGIFGSMSEGITGDPTILIAKALLDFMTAGIFATALGMSVAAIAVPQFIVQLALLFLGRSVMPLTTPLLIGDFSALGGIIMFLTGFRIAGVKSFPVGNLLPGLLLVMPVSQFWNTTLLPLIQGLA